MTLEKMLDGLQRLATALGQSGAHVDEFEIALGRC